MDGFALPPFESTCIFRDKDIISVKQKAWKKVVQHNDVHCIQDPEIVEKRPLPVDDEILAIEYQKDDSKHQEEVQCDHQCEENATANRKIENEDISSKRKWRDGDAGVPESSKRKKLKVANPGKHIGCSKEDNVHQDTHRCGSKMLKPSSIDIEAKKVAIQAEATVTLEEEQKTERNNQTELNCDTEMAGRNAQSDSKKVGSRSARRKRLKRQLRQKAKEQLKEVGDLIVYRLVELSSSWCPELSSYRVGKVLIYDPISMRIILLPVPEYPIIIAEEKKGEDESDMLVDMSHYSEDGSLEIEYSSLLDIRLLKGNESVPEAVSTPFRETSKKGGSLVRKPVTLDKNKGKVHSQTGPLVANNTKDSQAAPGKTQNKVWEENGEASNDKPEVQENGWGTWTPNASTSAWSYRAADGQSAEKQCPWSNSCVSEREK